MGEGSAVATKCSLQPLSWEVCSRSMMLAGAWSGGGPFSEHVTVTLRDLSCTFFLFTTYIHDAFFSN